MPSGINLSIREHRNILIAEMPPWMEVGDLDLLKYFSLDGHTYLEKIESIVVDGTEYARDEWTLGQLKTALAIPGTGNYDDCIIDLIEEIDSAGDVWIYTNPNFIQLDAMASILKKSDDRRNQLLTEMNPRLATQDGLLPFWEAIFQSERMAINGVLESDVDYMLRAISELFGQSSSIINIRRILEKYGLTNFILENSRQDSFKWNSRAESDSVNLHLEAKDYDKIPFLQKVFFNVTLAGKRLFVFCPAEGHDCFGAFYGQPSTEMLDYVVPTEFTPGSLYDGALPDSPFDTEIQPALGYGSSYGAFYGSS